MDVLDFFQGMIIGFSLIVAIGPQNLFVIQQGLKKQYIFIVCFICSLSDTILIIIGIILSIYLSKISSFTVQILKIVGASWLILYGILKIKNTFKSNFKKNENHNSNIANIIIITLAFTFLNPHVYLDTIILIGSISLNFNDKISFGFGVCLSSFIFFFSLGYFSKYVSKFINKNKTWKIIDILFGLLMIFYGLLFIIKI